MSDRDEATGQFSPAEPELYGQAALEHEAGYVPLKDGPAEDNPEELTAKEAADTFEHSSTPESEIRTYTGIAELDANVTMTIEQAAKALTDSNDADDAQAEADEADRIRKEVDELRGVDPAKSETPTEPLPPEAEVEKFLAIPHVKAAVEQLTGEAETARQNHLSGLAAATQIAETTFFNQFPEFANVSPEQRMNVFAAIAQNDPARAQSIKASVESIGNLFGRYSAEHQQAAAKAKTEFQTWARGEDQRFAGMMKGENMAAIEAEVPVMLKSLGVDPLEFLKSGNESRFLRSAPAQAILAKAAKYDLLMKAPKSAAFKALPPVQRPGVAGARSHAQDMSALDRRLAVSGSVKDATALYLAQQSRKRG